MHYYVYMMASNNNKVLYIDLVILMRIELSPLGKQREYKHFRMIMFLVKV